MFCNSIFNKTNPAYGRDLISPRLQIVATIIKLDWVGPVDNRPSPDKLNHFVKKKKIIIIIKPDT